MKNQIKEKTLITKCPKCGSRKFVISVFGNICGDCFYEEKAQIQENQIKEKIIEILNKEICANEYDLPFIADQILELFEQEKQKWVKEVFLYKFFIRGKNIQISNVLSYPASLLEKDKVYEVIVKKGRSKN